MPGSDHVGLQWHNTTLRKYSADIPGPLLRVLVQRSRSKSATLAPTQISSSPAALCLPRFILKPKRPPHPCLHEHRFYTLVGFISFVLGLTVNFLSDGFSPPPPLKHNSHPITHVMQTQDLAVWSTWPCTWRDRFLLLLSTLNRVGSTGYHRIIWPNYYLPSSRAELPSHVSLSFPFLHFQTSFRSALLNYVRR